MWLVFPLRNTHTPRWYCILPVYINTDHIQDAQKKAIKLRVCDHKKAAWFKEMSSYCLVCQEGYSTKNLFHLFRCACVCVSCLPVWKVVDLRSDSQTGSTTFRTDKCSSSYCNTKACWSERKWQIVSSKGTESIQIRLDLCCRNTGRSSLVY